MSDQTLGIIAKTFFKEFFVTSKVLFNQVVQVRGQVWRVISLRIPPFIGPLIDVYSSPVVGGTIEIYLNDELFDTITTGDEGDFIFLVPADDLGVGSFSVKAKYAGTPLVDRESWSPITTFTIYSELSPDPGSIPKEQDIIASDWLKWFILGGAVVATGVLAYKYRKKIWREVIRK